MLGQELRQELLDLFTLSAAEYLRIHGATEAQLAALPAPSEADRFALGGIRFLRALGFTGSDAQVLERAWKEAPSFAAAASSGSED